MEESAKDEYEDAKQALDVYYDKITEGLIIRSKANWTEYGEKSNKFFLTLERQHKNKSSIQKLTVDGEDIDTDEKKSLHKLICFIDPYIPSNQYN